MDERDNQLQMAIGGLVNFTQPAFENELIAHALLRRNSVFQEVPTDKLKLDILAPS